MAESLRIGLTGGIGSGKSTVARAFAERGARVVDTDAISRSLTAPGGAGLPAIAQLFGAEMIGPDGALDRGRMRTLVFHDPAAKQQLEAVLHPLIGQHTQAQAALARPGQTLVFDVPLLAESAHWRGRVDRVLVVDCTQATQVQRVVQRSGWAPEEVQRVIAQQASREQRRAIADAVILNDGITLAELDAQVGRLWQDWGCVG
ncbi:MAG TPA: dephospho-CoA kinase [Ideonella sp.]|nr:dephospho-CoA kinase [Ideonella sp.]